MLKLLAFALLLCAAFLPAHGQIVASPPVHVTDTGAYQFCVVVMANGSPFYLEYGQGERNAVANAELAQDAEKISKMTSLAAVLTYLSSRGWEYLSANSVTTDSHTTFSPGIRYGWSTNYLLRRRL